MEEEAMFILREQLYLLLEIDPEWSKNETTQLYQKITKLGRQMWMMNESETKLSLVTVEQYQQLRKTGVTLEVIAKQLKVNLASLKRWRVNQGIDY